jgi:DNA repair protein RadA/Sms
MILAVLEARCGVSLAQHDVYLNVAGGLKINEPAADLTVASALLSSFSGVALPPARVSFGEISLSGAVRASAHTASRLKEAKKLGFSEAVIPAGGDPGSDAANMVLTRLTHLKDLADLLRPCD